MCSRSSPLTDAFAGRLDDMATFLHTMVRITDPERSRGFYEALGFTFSRDMDIVRNGEREATNYFFSIGDAQNVLELTYNHDGRTYDLGTGVRAHRDRRRRPRRHARDARERARHRARATAVPGLGGRLADLLRSRPRRLPHRAHRTALSLGSSDTSQSSPLGGCRRKARKSRTSYALLMTPATRNGAPSETCRIGAATSGPSGRVT